MKKNIFISCALAVGMLPVISSCASDYLDQEPLTGISDYTVNESSVGAEAAVTGMARQMSRQFNDLKNSNMNASGEIFFRTAYGEGLSPDANFGEITNYSTNSTSPDNLRATDKWWAKAMYYYAYSIVNEANNILSSVALDKPDSELTQIQCWLKACSLTFRAHAYYRIMQVYGPRWADSDNGNALCIVLRLKSADENDHPFNTCNEVYDQMYSDLKEAIELFNNVPEEKRNRGTSLFYPDGSVAKGILARMAMLKNDYQTAQQMAHEARQGYPLMSADEIMGGFLNTCKGWMWAPAMDPLGVYYWGFGPHYACNGHYVNSWGYTSSMDWNLYRQMKATDTRAKLYFGPLTVDIAPELAAELGVTKEDFYTVKTSTPRASLSITGTGENPATDMNLAMLKFIRQYGDQVKAQYRKNSIDPKGIYPQNKYGMSIGIHYKFQGSDDGYTSCFPPFMRAEEMLLTEAEAAYMNGDATTAGNCIKELMAVRDASYELNATGADLLAEIKLQRKLELWGEGFSWFDYKRWNEVIARKGWDPKDPDNSGFWPNKYAQTYQPDFMKGWRAAIPVTEFRYNKEAKPSDVGL